MSEDGNVAATNLDLDELFIMLQPDEKSRQEAREWIKNNPAMIAQINAEVEASYKGKI